MVPNTQYFSTRCFRIDIPGDGMQFYNKRHHMVHVSNDNDNPYFFVKYMSATGTCSHLNLNQQQQASNTSAVRQCRSLHVTHTILYPKLSHFESFPLVKPSAFPFIITDLPQRSFVIRDGAAHSLVTQIQ